MTIDDASEEAWGTGEQAAADNVTLADMEKLSSRGFEIREKIKSLESEVKDLNSELREVKTKLLAYLTHFELKDYSSSQGKLFRKKSYSVKVPGADAGREEFFGYLKAEGIFDQLITVNSRTLNALYNEKREQAEEKGEIFNMPGVGSPVIFEDIQFRK